MEEVRLAWAFLVTFLSGATIFFIRWVVLTSMELSYCKCTHEFNQHWVLPKGMKAASYGIPEGEVCKVCGCKGFKRNDKDKRNSPPTKFFPR